MDNLVSNLASIEQFTFAVAGLEPKLRVARFDGDEGLSRLFRFSLDLVAEDGEIDFGSVVGKPGLLTIYGAQGERYVNGLVSRFEQGREVGRFTAYFAEFVPQLWLLSYRHKSRIFQKLSVRDIITKVLDEAGIASDCYRWVLQRSYQPQEFCVQYRESDLNFISRLMEEEGIFYYFEHTKERHVLVMADSTTAHMPIADPATVIFHAPMGAVPTEEYVFHYHYTEAVCPGAVELRDYNFKRPSLQLRADSQSNKDTTLEMYDYPGQYELPEAGTNLARIRMEELQVDRKRGRGKSVCRRYTPGYLFTLDRHPRQAFNQEYLLTRVSHTAAQPQVREEWTTGEGASYTNEFECIPSSIPFRPSRVTPKPVVKGSQTAVVVGPSGEEIYTDEQGYGRVKVQFHWDREGNRDENSSCWIRVSYPWAGQGWGAIAIPRIGQEVIIDFLEGDPDRPLITGRVYNDEQKPPYALPANRTQSGIKSRSTTGGDADHFNEIRFEDKKDEEQIVLHAQRDWNITVENDKKELVQANRLTTVQQEDRTKIGSGGKSLIVIGDVLEDFQRNHKETVTAEYELSAKKIVIEAGTEFTVKVGTNFIKIDASGITIQGLPMVKINSGGMPGESSITANPQEPSLP